YIWKASQVTEGVPTGSASSEATTSAATSSVSAGASSRPQASFDDTGATADVLTISLPFNDSQTFHKKEPFAYRFTLSAPLVVDVTASARDGNGEVRCTLFKTEEEGFSMEYYVGYIENGVCGLRTALAAGNYQLQVQSPTADLAYVVEAKAGTGDGNDGFSQALSLDRTSVRSDMLDANDLEDWFVFTVGREAQMTLSLTSNDPLRCLIYPAGDVDLFGFEGPACNVPYLYPAGTYYVGVGHASPKAARQTFTVQVR
ncbi:MAG: hypothetical protein PHW10_06345, partial [Candidatus Peribacteraceae bacterium]|nr:hypothetical protein [Candidatus Peribacteraceae bacterium]